MKTLRFFGLFLAVLMLTLSFAGCPGGAVSSRDDRYGDLVIPGSVNGRPAEVRFYTTRSFLGSGDAPVLTPRTGDRFVISFTDNNEVISRGTIGVNNFNVTFNPVGGGASFPASFIGGRINLPYIPGVGAFVADVDRPGAGGGNGGAVGCSHDWPPFDAVNCLTYVFCNHGCGAQRNRPHDWPPYDPADCTNPVQCANCNQTRYKPHTGLYDLFNCLTPVNCTVCLLPNVATRPHVPLGGYDPIDCMTPVQCANCAQNTFRAHDWQTGTDWTWDAADHWRACMHGCIQTSGVAPHTPDMLNDCTQCTEPGCNVVLIQSCVTSSYCGIHP